MTSRAMRVGNPSGAGCTAVAPAVALPAAPSSGAAFSVIGRNLLTFTDYKGYDPDVGGAIVRFDSFDYPRYRTITGSFEISF